MRNLQAILSQHTAPSQVIMDVMVLCIIVGAIDYLSGNRRGLGQRFMDGLNAFGSLTIAMTGIITLVPLIRQYLAPGLILFSRRMGFDPAMFAGMLLACDMGGYPLAVEIADASEAAGLSGMLLGSMMGATIVFTIPLSLSVISERDRRFMAEGVLYGFVTIPLGCVCGGLAAGYAVGPLLVNLIPVVLISAVILFLLWRFPNGIIRVFLYFGRLINIVACGATVLPS